MAPPPSAINQAYLKTAPKPKGPNVMIFVRWVEDGKTVAVHAEDLMIDDATKKPMSRGPWVYNGSMVNRGVFLAQADRSIAALVIDPAALINNERPDSDNDQMWSIAKDKVPKAGTPVEISIQLQAENAQADSARPRRNEIAPEKSGRQRVAPLLNCFHAVHIHARQFAAPRAAAFARTNV